MRKGALTVNSVTSAPATRAAPTAIATGRLRPVVIPFGLGEAEVAPAGAAVPGGTSSEGAPEGVVRVLTPLHLQQFGFLVLEQLLNLADVSVGQILELALGAAHVVLAGLAVLHQLVQRVLGVTADVANGDAAVLGLGACGLDVLAAALLG